MVVAETMPVPVRTDSSGTDHGRTALTPAPLGHNDPVTPSRPAPAPTPTWPGSHQPLGATWEEESTNFAVFAPEATSLQLCLFDDDVSYTDTALTEKTL